MCVWFIDETETYKVTIDNDLCCNCPDGVKYRECKSCPKRRQFGIGFGHIQTVIIFVRGL